MILRQEDAHAASHRPSPAEYHAPASAFLFVCFGGVSLLAGIALIVLHQHEVGAFSIAAGLMCFAAAQVIDLLGRSAHHAEQASKHLQALRAEK